MELSSIPFLGSLDQGTAALLILTLVMWTFYWKGHALWTAARVGDLKWFIVLLLINTLGILEIIYLYFFAKKVRVD